MKRIPVTIALLALSAGALSADGGTAQTPPATAPPSSSQSATAKMPAMDESRRVKAEEIDKLLAEGKVVLLDVREPRELEELGAIPDSVHIPLGQLEKRLGELPKDRLILTA